MAAKCRACGGSGEIDHGPVSGRCSICSGSGLVPEVRCSDCQDMGVECPKGYIGGAVRCDVCSYRFALTQARCIPIVDCPRCGGSATEEAGDGNA